MGANLVSQCVIGGEITCIKKVCMKRRGGVQHPVEGKLKVKKNRNRKRKRYWFSFQLGSQIEHIVESQQCKELG